MRDVMVDLETLGVVPGCVILSIGAVLFDDYGVAKDGFHQVIFRPSCELAGLHVDEKTEKWWGDQTPEAREVLRLAADLEQSCALDAALMSFNLFLQQAEAESGPVRIWGNGADFDKPILSAAYRAANVKVLQSWAYNGRCYRTVKNQYPDVRMKRTGTHHNALDDARSQANHLVDICQQRGFRLA